MEIEPAADSESGSNSEADEGLEDTALLGGGNDDRGTNASSTRACQAASRSAS